MGLIVATEPGATPLDQDEIRALIPAHIRTQAELNEWEHENIFAGRQWAFGLRSRRLLTIDFMQRLHERMFGNTWSWAGSLRTTEKNIGIDPVHIRVRLTELCRDIEAQLEYRSLPIREIGARFHHRLVLIHPFPNGNGRFARVMTDLLLFEHNETPFTWGVGDLAARGELRARYISALQAADRNNYEPLFEFLDVHHARPHA